jgi:putative sigma-54 modulation protein
MKTIIVSRQTDVPEELKTIIEVKLAKYDKYFRDDALAAIKLSRLRGRERVEITITSSGIIYRGEESDSTFRNALDLALDSIMRQIRKNKTKLEKRLRAGALSDFYTGAEHSADAEPEDEDIIIRTKSFQIKPMSPEEAILQMNLLGHDFFVFSDSHTGETNVVYRRHDGAYGLIIPNK